jgi:eukaryotic-like serine/threonine-protein kinase
MASGGPSRGVPYDDRKPLILMMYPHPVSLKYSPASLPPVSGRLPLRLGPYEVSAKIAGGGMATVFLGRATGPGGEARVAAVKAIKTELSQQEQFVHMFLDEAKILSRLEHPNVARTLEFGIAEEQHFIAMELLLGRTLLDVWDACVERSLPLRLDLAAWICARVAEGLHYAHELCDEDGTWLHVVHRDVNPSNIFLTFEGEVKLFDFGLARARGRRHKTEAGIVKGKVAYLAPEQLDQLPVDRRSDVFTLGTTLWEMTTMRRLFKRDHDLATVLAIKEGKVADPRALVAGYPEALWTIVQRALAKDRDARYQRASDLAHDLDTFVGSQPAGTFQRLIGQLLDDLFQGDRERQMAWLETTQTLSPRSAKATIAPPAPLPSVNIPAKSDEEAARVLAQYAPAPVKRAPPPDDTKPGGAKLPKVPGAPHAATRPKPPFAGTKPESSKGKG